MTRAVSNDVLTQKLGEALTAPLPPRTARDVRLPQVPEKAFAVIGVRRGGKSSFLQRRIAERIAAGEPPESHLLLSLEDDRLAGITTSDLSWLLDEHRRIRGSTRADGRRTLYLDEIHLVPGWETLVRRLLDARDTDVFVSGSSAKLLSREIHTSLRGRSMELLVHPFSFREALRHAGHEPTRAWRELQAQERADLDASLREYLTIGGFPEAQRLTPLDRVALLRGYVDLMLLRDVIERHRIGSVVALRRLQQHLLANPATPYSTAKFHRDLASQGIPVAQETLHALLKHLEDAFMVRLVALHTPSERQRQRNPLKVYPIDPGLIAPFEQTFRSQRGRRLETAILLELERRGYEADYLRIGENLEVDFHARHPLKEPILIQVALEVASEATWARETRALAAAADATPDARALLITLDATPPERPLPGRLTWQPAVAWLLGESA